MPIEELPGIPIDRPDITDGLPMAASAIYFLCSHSRGLLYLGCAANLRSRWRIRRYINDERDIYSEMCHHRLKQSIELGDVMIRWWELPREYLEVAESVLLQIHGPPWNNQKS